MMNILGTGRIVQFLSENTAFSSRRLIAYRAAMILLVCQCALTAVICYQGMMLHSVDNGVLTAWTFEGGIIAALTKFIFYRPKENADETKPGTPDEGV